METPFWQTTNLQPWVEALAAGLITAKTRVMRPCVPVGALVLLHASKSKLWRDYSGLRWTKDMDPKKWDRGMVVAIAHVEAVGMSDRLLSKRERKFWDVYHPDGSFWYNSAAEWTVRFHNIRRLKTPLAIRGFQAPFARATDDTISALRRAKEL